MFTAVRNSTIFNSHVAGKYAYYGTRSYLSESLNKGRNRTHSYDKCDVRVAFSRWSVIIDSDQ
jgi:hypothetical protein